MLYNCSLYLRLYLCTVLEKADREGIHCYLESSNPRNVSFYERAGFENKRTVELKGGKKPLLTLMRRDPKGGAPAVIPSPEEGQKEENHHDNNNNNNHNHKEENNNVLTVVQENPKEREKPTEFDQ